MLTFLKPLPNEEDERLHISIGTRDGRWFARYEGHKYEGVGRSPYAALSDLLMSQTPDDILC